MDKIRETNLKKYGKEYVLSVLSVREKSCATKLKRYGNPYYCNTEKANRTKIQRYGSTSYNNRQKAKETTRERYGVDNTWQLESVRQKNWHTVSKVNKGFKELLYKSGIESQFEHKIDNYSYDLYLPRKNIVIEIDPTFTHKSTEDRYFGKNKIEPLDKYYHYNKTMTAYKNGIYCIHIFDWDNKEKAIQLILENKEYDIDTVTEIPINRIQEFIELYSLKNFEYDNEISAFGYVVNNELIQLVLFRENQTVDMVHKFNVIVKNGYERILDYYKRVVEIDILSYYCDISKESIFELERMGFKIQEKIDPQLHWSYRNKESNKRINEKYKGVYDCGYYVLEY